MTQEELRTLAPYKFMAAPGEVLIKAGGRRGALSPELPAGLLRRMVRVMPYPGYVTPAGRKWRSRRKPLSR